MKKNILLSLLLGSTLLLGACEVSPIQSNSSNPNAPLDASTTNESTVSPPSSSDTTTNDVPLDTEAITEAPDVFNIFDEIDWTNRTILEVSSDNTTGYHDALDPINVDQLGLTPEMILENEDLRPLVQHLVNNKYNYTYGAIGYVQDADSIYTLSNKLNHLPADYVPADLVEPEIDFYFAEFLEKKQLRSEAAMHMEELFSAAKEDGYTILGASGYRSYRTQKGIYERNVANRGQEATDKVSARPGHSEHQTGLALDVTLHALNYRLVDELGEMDEGIWLKDHAHEFGFIIRYSQEDTAITGYSYEPWHLRYIGKDVATFIYEHDLTVEELYMYIESLIEENTGL